jgi:hypothetical protein
LNGNRHSRKGSSDGKPTDKYNKKTIRQIEADVASHLKTGLEINLCEGF